MAAQYRDAVADDTRESGEMPDVNVHRTSPGRMVFTEDGNSEGWIATDLAVDLRR